jgi:hypothetical protein
MLFTVISHQDLLRVNILINDIDCQELSLWEIRWKQWENGSVISLTGNLSYAV